jgi:hypothetical protein
MNFKFSFLFLLFSLNLLLVAQDLKVITSDFNSITIEYRPVIKDTIPVSQNGQSFLKLVIPGTVVENISAFGIPQLLARSINIGVQGEFGNTIQILSSSYSTLSGRYAPNPFFEKDSVGRKENYRAADGYNSFQEKELVTFGEYGLMRNLPVQSVKIYPVQFDASLNSIKIYSKIVFKINIGSSNAAKVKIEDDSYQRSILNWPVAKNWGVQKTSLSKIANSTLATGNWYRFETPTEGIYKIDRTFLQNLGIDLSSANFDPRTIKIYGYGGAALPEDLSLSNNTGMIENAISVVGEQDGSFDSADYILFYGRGTEFFEYNSANRSVVRKRNPFSTKNYYWLTYGGNAGKRMAAKNSLTVSNASQQLTTQAFVSHEKDSVNLGQTGREYFGEKIDNKGRTFINSLTGLYPDSKITYQVRVAAIPDKDMFTYRISESGKEIGSASFYPLYEYDIARDDDQKITYTGGLTDERSALKFASSAVSISAQLFLDYYIISYQKYLRAVNDNLMVFAKDTTANIDYSLTNFSSSTIQVFDVTDFSNVKAITGGLISGGQYRFISSETAGKPSKYLGVTSSGFKTPASAVKMENSNIRGTISGSELIVITAKDFKTQAERYAKYRSSESANKFSTQVFYVDEIMNEFAGGVTDPTAIRDFLKFAYDNWKIKPFYVLLFGDASFDILNTIADNKNFVPAYESQASLNKINSYPTDDYYARVAGNDHKPDMAISRLTVQSTKEAEVAVDKIINYETVQSKGDWRNKITLVADDGPAGVGDDDGSRHTSQSEDLSNYILPKTLSQDKIYLVAYPTEYIGSGRRKPAANTALINSINNGTLIVNFIGHGSPELLAHEEVFVKATTVPQLVNKNYFFLTVASCDFGWYDSPTIQSSTEALMALPTSGSIMAFSASRVSYSDYNALLNDSLYSCLFKARDSNNLPIPVGKAYFLAKQYSTGDLQNDEKFELFGDPTIRLNLPTLPVQIDSINGKSTSVQTQISALSKIKVKGSVKDTSGKISAMNGEVILTVYDSDRSIYYPEMNYTVSQQGGLIFKGRASLTNGIFETEFMVPKDISYEDKTGKIVAYVSNSITDGVGYTNNFTVGGTSQTTVNDGKGPEIEIYFDDNDIESSYLVNQNFTLHAKLKDQTGLNTTGSGIGHKLEAVLNDDLTNSIDLTGSFVGDLNSGGKSGNVSYSFTNMDPGDYKLKVKAWDVFNNFSFQDAMFTVVESSNGIVIRDVVNYPNPFSSSTTFTFKHNYGSGINLKIKVYTVAGRLIKTIENFSVMDKFVRTDWDGGDEDGNQLANGTYLYKLIVDSIDGTFHDAVLGKLAIVR